MPIYEYRCSSCSHELEKLQRLSEAPLTDCPACGKAALRRLISAAGFRLKGSGWYETDFKKDRKRNVAGSSSDGEGQAGNKDEGKSSDGGKSDKATSSDTGGKTSTEKGSDSKSSPQNTNKSSSKGDSNKGNKASAA